MNAAALNLADRAEPVTSWPAPDMSILSGGRTSPPPMPTEMFGELWPLVNDLAAGAGSPVDYVAVGVLAVCASLIGAKRRVQPYVTTPQWQEPCVLWVAPVGDPSSNKSPAIDAATGPLRAMEAELAEHHKTRLLGFQTVAERARQERSEWQAQVKTATKDGVATPPMPEAAVDPDEPQRPRLVVQDATPEAMGDILAGNPNGTLHLRDELAAWLMSFERYSPGGREFWLEAYGGREHTVDRKGNKAGPVNVSFNGVTVLGGIQPEKLRECLLRTADDGLVPRFLWVWPDPIQYRRPRQVADVGKLERLYRRLQQLEAKRSDSGKIEPRVLLLASDTADVFEAWVRENDDAVREASSLYKGFVGKLRGMVLRLALVVELMGWAAVGGCEPDTISVKTLAAVLGFVDDYAKPSALRVFGDAALPEEERNAAALARYIQKTKPKQVNARDIRRSSGIPTLKQANDVDLAIEALIEAGWLRGSKHRDGSTPGQPRKDYAVNPAVLS
ncbi:YfjI family protein [Sphingomonas sp. 10B4]|uniref:YfjI family protein n=1 Tax=Sphingomonas sp. 10B4 TaxID=3048575 RepID=UPI002AB3C226|nr:YfjI family protein [Sphingomonas sp. 10B4]MDY7525853.1 YfjI family protein [Sphingomonas sp. 10B4]MEB0284544.1 YfjI family protein [Sphingomonas sp. 10B4]